MSRSGYTDDYGADEDQHLGLYRGAVERAIRGKRGQAFLRELVAVLDAMPDKRLLSEVVDIPEGCCAIGAVGRARGIDLLAAVGIGTADSMDGSAQAEATEAYDWAGSVGSVLNIATALAREVVHLNDESGEGPDRPRSRWQYMRDWAAGNIIEVSP